MAEERIPEELTDDGRARIREEQRAMRARPDRRAQGLVIVNTGNGKGKSSSGFGMVIRAMGHGMRVGVVQFIKGAWHSAERDALEKFGDQVSWHTMGEGFTWETQNRERDIEKAQAAWEKARTFLSDPAIGLVVLDELNIALKYQYLDVQKVIADLLGRPEMQHVVITGRGAPPELIEIADTVTEMQVVKHAFKDGIMAQAGVEW